MKNAQAVNDFVDFYKNFSMENINIFNKVYDKEIIFQDPFHKISGRNDLFIYFKKMMKEVSQCQFEIFDIYYAPADGNKDSSALITWDMHFKHKKLNSSKMITVNGVTKIVYKDQVIFHRDYFDSSQLIYKNIPVLGSIIRFIEKGI